jgi:hypothetical protein
MHNPSFLCKDLATITQKHSPTTLIETKRGALLFTEYGARLLGLFPRRNNPNVLWNPVNIDEVLTNHLWCIGGERLWLSPERTFYYDNPRDFEGWFIPSEMDPGNYVTLSELNYQSIFTAFDCSMNETYENCKAQRTFTIAKDPYDTTLDHVGVCIADSMKLTISPIDMCAWSLAMVYTAGQNAPGTAFFPVKPDATPLSYIKPVPSDRIDVFDGYCRYKIDASEIYKIALRPEDMCLENQTKAVYISPYPNSSDWFCIIKRSNDMPHSQSDCVDPAKCNPLGPRGATQSFNSGPTPLGEHLLFGEIELQFSKGIEKNGSTISSALHEIHAYAGTKKEILDLARIALHISVTPQIYN